MKICSTGSTLYPLPRRRFASGAKTLLLLATHFLTAAVARYERTSTTLSADAYSLLLSAPWPGNVGELKNVIEAAAVLAVGSEIHASDLCFSQQTASPEAAAPLTFKEAKHQVINAFERDFVTRVLRRHQGNITKAAEERDLHRQQLQQKIRELGIRGWKES